MTRVPTWLAALAVLAAGATLLLHLRAQPPRDPPPAALGAPSAGEERPPSPEPAPIPPPLPSVSRAGLQHPLPSPAPPGPGPAETSPPAPPPSPTPLPTDDELVEAALQGRFTPEFRGHSEERRALVEEARIRADVLGPRLLELLDEDNLPAIAGARRYNRNVEEARLLRLPTAILALEDPAANAALAQRLDEIYGIEKPSWQGRRERKRAHRRKEISDEEFKARAVPIRPVDRTRQRLRDTIIRALRERADYGGGESVFRDVVLARLEAGDIDINSCGDVYYYLVALSRIDRTADEFLERHYDDREICFYRAYRSYPFHDRPSADVPPRSKP